jgi:retron-type reverse transcriptase
MRELGIPTLTDRLIQQALLQGLQPRIDPTFSEHSYGFRPGRRAHDAVLQAQRYVQDGYRIVVDVDLEKFFDRVHHAASDLNWTYKTGQSCDGTRARDIRRLDNVRVDSPPGTHAGF